VSNPFPFTTPNPQVQPMSVITTAPPRSGLNGYLQFDNEISGSQALAVLQYSTALQITNPSAGTPAATYDISAGGITIPTGGATLTVQAPIMGTGELFKTQAGTVSLANALTQNPTANAYSYSGGTAIAEGTVISFEGSGTPVGRGLIQMVGSTLSLQPVARTAPVALSLASAGPNAIYAALTPQTLNTNATVYALKLENVGIQGVNGTLAIGQGAANEVSGIIFNGGSIGNLKLAFGAAQAAIFTSQAGSIIGAGISGTAGLVKFGPGNLTLSGRNGYSGKTVVASGTLTINNGSTPGIGDVAVYSGATLTGNGAILGNIILNNGATRNGAGIISGNVDVESGATFSGGGVVYSASNPTSS